MGNTCCLKRGSEFFKVDDTVYRSAQPTKEGFDELKKFGIKTVIDLRFFHNDKELIKTTGLNQVSIQMLAISPQEDEVVTFLKIISDKKNGPFLIHCHHGSDRTGIIIAGYRIILNGWTKEEAINEMLNGGTRFHPLFETLDAFIKHVNVNFIRDLDVEKIKTQVGIK
jgi:tyrosine-protein phosphatase SIW14